MINKKLNLLIDMYGCPNRCKHCWIGHMPNNRMDDDADAFVVNYFYDYFNEIEFYSWLREPDYTDDYENRWYRDIELSKNCKPERFELASFYRIVRDDKYIPFLKKAGVKKVLLTLFGLKDTTDKYVGRKNAYEEILKATDLLIDNDIIPRWQCFINEENKDEIVEIYHLYQSIKESKCKDMEFFVHEGTCDGENRKLYPIRINKENIPKELIPVYPDYDEVLTEKEICEILKDDNSHPYYHNEDLIVLYISNNYDVYYNFTNMSKPWIIGNLKKDDKEELINKIINEDTYALNMAKEITFSDLVKKYGDIHSNRVFSIDDYKDYLFNEYLNELNKE